MVTKIFYRIMGEEERSLGIWIIDFKGIYRKCRTVGEGIYHRKSEYSRG